MLRILLTLVGLIGLTAITGCTESIEKSEIVDSSTKIIPPQIVKESDIWPLYESKEFWVRMKLPLDWKWYKTTTTEYSIAFYLPTTSPGWINSGLWEDGYALITTFIFYTPEKWGQYLENCKGVKEWDFWSYTCTEEGIKDITIGKTNKYTIVRVIAPDSPPDFEKYHNQWKHDYLRYIKDNLEVINE